MARTRFITHFAQGMLMGGSDIIPGVSGGTMALIVGIYERLVGSISLLFRGVLGAGSAAGRAKLREVEWGLLLPLGLGIVTAIIAGSYLITTMLERYPQQSHGLFFGLVAASVAIPWGRIDHRGPKELGLLALCAALAFLLTGLPEGAATEPSLLRVFLSAAVAICAMILPGISGAFLLKAMGMYEITLAALHSFDVPYVTTFVAGVGIGIGVFSGVLKYLLEHHHDLTMAALVGLMLGALRALWPWQVEETRTLLLPGTGDPIVSVVLLALLGFGLVTALAVWGDRKIDEQLDEVEEGAEVEEGRTS